MKPAVPNLFGATDRFNVRQLFQGRANKVWWINTRKAHDVTVMKTVVFSKYNDKNAV